MWGYLPKKVISRGILVPVLGVLLTGASAFADCNDHLLPFHPSLFALKTLQETEFEELGINTDIEDHFIDVFTAHKDWRRGPEDKGISATELDDTLGGLRRVYTYFQLRLRRRELTRLEQEAVQKASDSEGEGFNVKPVKIDEEKFKRLFNTHPDVKRLEALTMNVILRFAGTYFAADFFHRLDRDKEGLTYFLATTREVPARSGGDPYRFTLELDGESVIVEWPAQGGFSYTKLANGMSVRIQFSEITTPMESRIAHHGQRIKNYKLVFSEKGASNLRRTGNEGSF